MDTNITLDKQSQDHTSRGVSGAGEPTGFVPGIVGAGVELAGTGVRTTISLIGELRGQTYTLTTQSIDLAEGIVRGVFEMGRRTAKRMDQAVGEALGAVERAANTTLGALRATSDQAARLAMSVCENAVGQRRSTGSN